MSHPRYSHPSVPGEPSLRVHIDDAAAHVDTPTEYAGTITAIYLSSVELSTGDEVPAINLVLLRRALDGAP